jgi:hypothetical protein
MVTEFKFLISVKVQYKPNNSNSLKKLKVPVVVGVGFTMAPPSSLKAGCPLHVLASQPGGLCSCHSCVGEVDPLRLPREGDPQTKELFSLSLSLSLSLSFFLSLVHFCSS